MDRMEHPILLSSLCLLLLVLSSWLGATVRGRRELTGDSRDSFTVVLTAALTLLGLIIAFSFSMAVNRYDQRKAYEEAEANAIGTEYARANLLAAADATLIKELLRRYMDLRIEFYLTRDVQPLPTIADQTAQLEDRLLEAVRAATASSQTPVTALAVSGMNDVVNAESYTQAAWWNRIPVAAWILVIVIAVICGVMLGFGQGIERWRNAMMLMLPLIVSIALFLIADIDSPRGGIIRVRPQNLAALQYRLGR